jgi:hypothetical protein
MLFARGTRAVAVLLPIAIAAMDGPIQLNVPTTPPAGTQMISGSFQGYSMEMASFASIAGNMSYAPLLPQLPTRLINSQGLQTNYRTKCSIT